MNRGSIWSGKITPQSIPDPVNRAVDTWNMILDKPAVIKVQRRVPGPGNQTITLAEQTVRLEVIQNIRESNELRDAWVSIPRIYVELVGVKNHPFVPDTDLQRSDLFFYQDRMWEVTEIIDNIPGRLLANGSVQT